MNKLESYGVSLVPVAVAAGLLSGTLFRPAPASEESKLPPKPPEAARRAEDTPANPWLSDLRPVMETIADAMGLSLQRDAISRTAGITASELDHLQEVDVTKEILTVRAELQRFSNAANPCTQSPSDASVASAERTLNAYLLSLSDKDSDSSSKIRRSVAEATLNELHDWRALAALEQKTHGTDEPRAPDYHVEFIVATVPDYVDSNSGWVADQSLAAIQSAMSRSKYLLDRFRLIDWTRRDPRSDNPVASDSRVHERQPGALILRRRDGEAIKLEVVLLALETPTSGVHRPALRNAIRFIRAWNRCTGVNDQERDLRVLGPTFSGSSLSLALTLSEPEDRFWALRGIRLISGSATADENIGIFADFAPLEHDLQRCRSADVRDPAHHGGVSQRNELCLGKMASISRSCRRATRHTDRHPSDGLRRLKKVESRRTGMARRRPVRLRAPRFFISRSTFRNFATTHRRRWRPPLRCCRQRPSR